MTTDNSNVVQFPQKKSEKINQEKPYALDGVDLAQVAASLDAGDTVNAQKQLHWEDVGSTRNTGATVVDEIITDPVAIAEAMDSGNFSSAYAVASQMGK